MRIMRKLARATAVTVIVAAAFVLIAVGGFELLLRRLPSYQDEIQSWVTAELKLTLDYTRLDGAWGWRGPELAFRDVRVRAAGDAVPFLTARSASVGFHAFDLVRLALGRDLAVDRLTFDGTEFTLVRNADGVYRLQGAPAVSGEAATVQVPPDVDVLVRNSRVLYLDAARNVAWAFQDVVGSLRRDDGVLTVEASGLPPAEFADRIDVSIHRRRRGGCALHGRLAPLGRPRRSRSCRGCALVSAVGRRTASGPRERGRMGRMAGRHGHERHRRSRGDRRCVAEPARRRRFAFRAHRVVRQLAAHERGMAVRVA
jgi:hypothetical protein